MRLHAQQDGYFFFLSSEIGMYIEYVMEYAYTHTFFFFFSKWGNNTVQK